MVKKYYGYFGLDLFRLGNGERNKIDIVRNRDIEEIEFYRCCGVDSKTPTGRIGEVRWVKGGPGGGISLFDDIESAPISGRFWYRIPVGVDIPSGLGLCDSRRKKNRATHYTIFPATPMPLDNFKALLREIAEDVKVKPMFEKKKIDNGR